MSLIAALSLGIDEVCQARNQCFIYPKVLNKLGEFLSQILYVINLLEIKPFFTKLGSLTCCIILLIDISFAPFKPVF